MQLLDRNQWATDYEVPKIYIKFYTLNMIKNLIESYLNLRLKICITPKSLVYVLSFI